MGAESRARFFQRGSLMIERRLTALTNPAAALQENLFGIFEQWRSGSAVRDSPFPLRCETCESWSIHRVTAVTCGKITTRCGARHINHHEIPALANEIRADYTRMPTLGGRPLSLAICRKYAEQDHADFYRALSRHRFRDIPRGYADPGSSLYPATFTALERWRDPTMHDARRIMLIADRLASPAPIFQWVADDLFRAIRAPDFPPGDLADLRFRWPHGAFFLPRGALTAPSGNSCPFIAFAVIDRGHHAIGGIERAFFAMVPKLLCWTMAPESMETYTAEMTLAGTLEKAEFNAVRRPKHEEGRDFVREALRLALLLNVTAKTVPNIAQEPRLARAIRKKGRKHRDTAPTLLYHAPLYGERPPSQEPVRRSEGRHNAMSPHWRPAWTQRNYRGPGRRECFTFWRPAQFINGHGINNPQCQIRLYGLLRKVSVNRQTNPILTQISPAPDVKLGLIPT